MQLKKFFVKDKKGQSTVEFMLLLGTVVSLILTFFVLFHEKLAGMFFYLIGGVLG
ncbi:Flp pilus assembly pilin Flp [Elusimicrobium simillimum]